ncbi:hypothetical protein BD408DRAFT_460792 [Parasitella parasitica]|nr:hypothetical protein BD408DRAFT_460792 [Parasitella parasitica]
MCNDCFSVDAFPSAPRAKEKHIQMFQSKSYIERRHGKIGVDRATYLKQLVQEFETTDNKEAKKQVLANLANFAYDPINYNTLWDLHAVNLFLTSLTDSDPLLREFGIGGLANICLGK